MIVLDTSASTDGSGALAAGRSAVKALLPKLTKGTQVALVAAGSDALLAERFTTDMTAVDSAMTRLTPAGDGALWEGVARAAGELKVKPTWSGRSS